MGIPRVEFNSYFEEGVFVIDDGIDAEIGVEKITALSKPGKLVYCADSLLNTGLGYMSVTVVAEIIAKRAGVDVEFRIGSEVLCRVESTQSIASNPKIEFIRYFSVEFRRGDEVVCRVEPRRI